jgi:hypothetical protein
MTKSLPLFHPHKIRRKLSSWVKRLLNLSQDELQVRGVPGDIDFETLNEFCIEHYGEPLRKVSYIHISGWKSAGSHLLILKTRSGREHRLIYKNAVYNLDHIPSLDGLPIKPGKPEFTLLSHANRELADYLPAVYYAHEVIPERHYQYLMEDLSLDFRMARSDQDTLMLTPELSKFHQTMSEWQSNLGNNGLLHYGHTFSLDLQEYAIREFEQYSHQVPNSIAVEVCQRWSEITEVHGRREFHELMDTTPIHGDFNHSNVYIHRSDSKRIKLVDWEWAGHGLPHADLASLLKGELAAVEAQALLVYASQCHQLNYDQHKRLYLWCQMERGLLDASFLAAHQMTSKHKPRFDIQDFIEYSLLQVLRSYHELT